MSLISENVIPGKYGKVFGTDAIEKTDLERIEKLLYSIDGIKKVIINFDIYPREITVHTSKLVRIEDIENKIKTTGNHLIPKGLFEL
ncbi:heavy-metal-associated domain-containing protein [Winogradskyella aurantia]|uniref:HMA domain-containing protein n=1 Tax=Winogradskyella aurantia TaxID=1915063 RepID=A0A265UPJ0_9FLAO|nr:heavy-metal-associated domain-containing protein [Winogradskyella aurantia]OZV67256.1 hypothetical protein CA834_12390 [Winogradskyella aurantia]